MVPKNTVAIISVIALLMGWTGGYLLASSSSDSDESSSVMQEEAMVHAHETYELDPAEADIPSVQLLAEKDSKSGWNLTLETENFEFDPQSVNGENEEGKGHAHLWVDGVKLTRLYSNNFYLDNLEPGEHELSVTLNTNQHQDYVVNGEIIRSNIDVVEDRNLDGADSGSHTH